MKRKEAKDAGLTRYNTGKPCKHGHVADRWVWSGVCVQCQGVAQKRWAANNTEQRRDQSRDYYRRSHGVVPTRPEPPTCECCKELVVRPRLDHDHEDDTFRGWLCNRCNTGIGLLGDTLEGVILAMTYLVRHKQNQRQHEPNHDHPRVRPQQDTNNQAVSDRI